MKRRTCLKTMLAAGAGAAGVVAAGPVHPIELHVVLRDERDRYNAGQEGRGFSPAADGRGCHAGL
jgi:hypothetical protein